MKDKRKKYDYFIHENNDDRVTDLAESIKEVSETKYCNRTIDALKSAFKKSSIIPVSSTHMCERVYKESYQVC